MLLLPERLAATTCDLIHALLAWQPLNRLGCLTGGAADVKAHALFTGEDWAALLAQQRPAPYVPPLSHASDTAHFRCIEDATGFVDEPEYDYDGPPEWDRDF